MNKSTRSERILLAALKAITSAGPGGIRRTELRNALFAADTDETDAAVGALIHSGLITSARRRDRRFGGRGHTRYTATVYAIPDSPEVAA